MTTLSIQPVVFSFHETHDVLPAIRKTGSYSAPDTRQHAEPLSNQQQDTLKRLVWLMSSGMKFKQAWSNGIWHALRSVTGRPSPQPFSVEDLPALKQECIRLMKVTSATHRAMYEFEKSVIRLAVRKDDALEPLIEDMHIRLIEIQKQESEGMLILSKWENSEIGRLMH